MKRALIALMDQGILALDQFTLGFLCIQLGDKGVVFPKLPAGRLHVRHELPGIRAMQIPYGGREHHDVTGGLGVLEDQLAHDCMNKRAPSSL